ncbi:MAG: NF038122 family metalloprotease, partial [Rhodopila sp.]
MGREQRQSASCKQSVNRRTGQRHRAVIQRPGDTTVQCGNQPGRSIGGGEFASDRSDQWRPFFISSSQEKAWGLLSPAAPGIDGTIGFSTSYAFSFDPNARAQPGLYDFIALAEHEITHAMGRFAGLQYAPNWYSPMDLVRYAASGQLALSKDQASYFSIDGGQTSLLPFDSSPAGDAGDWAASVANDPFGYSHTNLLEPVSAVDITMMDVLGFSIAGTPGPVAASAPSTAADFAVSNLTTGASTQEAGTPYTGSASDVTQSIILVTPDNLHIVAEKPDSFIRTGGGDDTIDVSQTNGNNILDGGGGSNFLIGGSGIDTFSIDDGSLTTDVWSTVFNFHSGDSLTIQGGTPADFTPAWMDDPGAAGLTGVFSAPGSPMAAMTLAGYTTADLGTRLTVTYGQTQDASGA